MKQMIHVIVTQDDLDHGEKGCTRACAIHNAIERLNIIKEPFGVFDSVFIPSRPNVGRDLGELPVDAMNKLLAWDAGRPVDPFEFDMELNYSHDEN